MHLIIEDNWSWNDRVQKEEENRNKENKNEENKRREEVQEGHFEAKEKMAKPRSGLSIAIQLTYQTKTRDCVVKYTFA